MFNLAAADRAVPSRFTPVVPKWQLSSPSLLSSRAAQEHDVLWGSAGVASLCHQEHHSFRVMSWTSLAHY